ncbi:Apolipoprotein D, partial [Papilio xuthus]
YLGRWRLIETYFTEQQSGTCNDATYTLNNNVVDVYNTQVINQQLDTINGTATLATTDGSAKLLVNFPGKRKFDTVPVYWRNTSTEQQSGTCNDATYTLNNNVVDVYNTQVINQQLDTINGTATLATTDGSAKLLVNFPGTSAPADYWVLDTDYDSYALVYSCRNINAQEQREVVIPFWILSINYNDFALAYSCINDGSDFRKIFSWKLSRTKQLSAAANTAMNSVMANNVVLDNQYYQAIDQSDRACFFLPDIPLGQPVVLPGQCNVNIPVVQNFNVARSKIMTGMKIYIDFSLKNPRIEDFPLATSL